MPSMTVTVKDISFLKLFDGKVQYLVPRWQRRYRWGEPEIRCLLDDMLAIAEAENQARSHYGGIVITVREGNGVMKVHHVVDGQQRLATVSMLLARVAEILDSGGQYGELTTEVIRLDLLTNPNRQKEEQRKLRLQDGDEEEYRRIIELDHPESGDGAVAKAWRYLRRNVSSANVEAVINGLHRLHVITVGLEDRDDAQQIFESLNATGKPLTEGEKVKNWLLMGLSEENQNSLYDKHWLNIEKALDARQNADRIDTFLRDMIRWRTGKLAAEGTYDEFRRWAIREGHDNSDGRSKLCSELEHLASLYGKLTGAAGQHPDKRIEGSLRHLRAMGIDAHRPFTLRLLWDLSPDGGANSTSDQTAKVLAAVSSWITRIWLADRSVTDLPKVFAELANARIPDGELDPAWFWTSRIASICNERTSVPSDEEVYKGVRLTSKYGGRDTRATKAVLYAINDDDAWGETPPFDKLTVEHVMPQTLSEDWREHLGEKADEVHEKYLHRLGNLTLCGPRWGSAISNHLFKKKKEFYRKSSVMMTRQLAELPTWDADTIKRRADELAEKALRLWPRPSGL